MNKLFQKIAICLLAGSVLSVWTSCNDDDNVTLPNNEIGEIVPGSGEKLLSAGEFRFFYTPEGQLSYIRIGESTRYDFSSNQIICNYYYYTDNPQDTNSIVTTFTRNKKGYVEKMSSTEVWSFDDELNCMKKETVNTYDNEGHLIKISLTSVEEFIDENGDKISAKGTGNLFLTWEEGLLTKVKNEGSWDDGYSYSKTVIFNYGNKEYPNRYRQYASFMTNIFNTISEICSWIGLYGAGPDYWPVTLTTYNKEVYNGEVYEDNDTINYTYNLNADGTIRSANNRHFTYGPLSSATISSNK